MLTPIQVVGRATPLKRTQNHRRAQTLEFVRIKCNELCVYLVQFVSCAAETSFPPFKG